MSWACASPSSSRTLELKLKHLVTPEVKDVPLKEFVLVTERHVSECLFLS